MLEKDVPIYEDIFKSVDEYTGMKGCHNKRYPVLPYPQRLYVLSEMLKLHVLRETGDIKKFLRLDKQIMELGDYHPSKSALAVNRMMEWLQLEMDNVRPLKTESTKEKVVLSMLIWGARYASKMLECSLRSLMAPGNIPAMVKEKTVILHIQTDDCTKGFIETQPIVKKMQEMGVHFECALIPEEIIECLHDENVKWWMVGSGASLAMHYAKKSGAAFHHSYPDVIYSDKYFTELMRLSKLHNSILGQAHRADESLLLPSLSPYINDDSMAVPSGDLAALHLNAIHMGAYSLMVNHRPKFWTYPQSHVTIWEGQEYLHYNCPHLNIMWLSPGVLRNLADRFYMTLDSELDLICHGDDFYIPQENDDIYLVEFSEQCKGTVDDVYVDAHACGNWIWSKITHRDLMKFYIRGMKVRINRSVRPVTPDALPENQIAAEKNFLFNAIIASDPYAGIALARKRTHEGRIFAFQ